MNRSSSKSHVDYHTDFDFLSLKQELEDAMVDNCTERSRIMSRSSLSPLKQKFNIFTKVFKFMSKDLVCSLFEAFESQVNNKTEMRKISLLRNEISVEYKAKLLEILLFFLFSIKFSKSNINIVNNGRPKESKYTIIRQERTNGFSIHGSNNKITRTIESPMATKDLPQKINLIPLPSHSIPKENNLNNLKNAFHSSVLSPPSSQSNPNIFAQQRGQNQLDPFDSRKSELFMQNAINSPPVYRNNYTDEMMYRFNPYMMYMNQLFMYGASRMPRPMHMSVPVNTEVYSKLNKTQNAYNDQDQKANGYPITSTVFSPPRITENTTNISLNNTNTFYQAPNKTISLTGEENTSISSKMAKNSKKKIFKCIDISKRQRDIAEKVKDDSLKKLMKKTDPVFLCQKKKRDSNDSIDKLDENSEDEYSNIHVKIQNDPVEEERSQFIEVDKSTVLSTDMSIDFNDSSQMDISCMKIQQEMEYDEDYKINTITQLFSKQLSIQSLNTIVTLLKLSTETATKIKDVMIDRKYPKEKLYILLMKKQSEKNVGIYLRIDPERKKYSLIKKKFF